MINWEVSLVKVKMDIKRRICASIFLVGYISFVLLSITHFHSPEPVNSGKASLVISTVISKTPGDTEDNCPICHLFSSVNFNSFPEVNTILSSVHEQIDPVNESNFESWLSDSQFLRGPPASLSFSLI